MEERPRILIIEDEPAIADTLIYALGTEGFAPEWCATGRAGLAAMAAKPFAFVVLDVGLPDGTGFEVCKQIRVHSAVPVLFLTARNTELDRVLGLELGGDDYLVKPFSPRELTARVKAILRRTSAGHSTGGGAAAPQRPEFPDANPPATQAGSESRPHQEILVDAERCAIRYRGVALDLTRYEFRLLKALAARPGRVFTRDQLMTAAWEDPGASLDRTVDAHIKTLRAKLRAITPDDDPIRTHRGLGYSVREAG
ncbi:MAG: two-component system response regulator CreB [Opitutaceae bacterium]|nr:two-component system response regulator CreB [Opitutaceae bacterium]